MISILDKIRTQIHNLNILKKALNDLNIEWKTNSTELKDFQGQTHLVDLVISQSNKNDIGFIWNGKGATRF